MGVGEFPEEIIRSFNLNVIIRISMMFVTRLTTFNI